MFRKIFSLVLVVLLSLSGLKTSLHLAELHYGDPSHKLNLINSFPVLEKFFDRAELQREINLRTIEEVTGGDETPYNPYGKYLNNGDSADISKNDGIASSDDTLCFESEYGSCEDVDGSIYSEFPLNSGIGVSVYGVAGYFLIIFISLFLLVKKRWNAEGLLPILMLGCAWGGLFISGRLTYLEAVKICSFCPLCVKSAKLMIGVFLLANAGYGYDYFALWYGSVIKRIYGTTDTRTELAGALLASVLFVIGASVLYVRIFGTVPIMETLNSLCEKQMLTNTAIAEMFIAGIIGAFVGLVLPPMIFRRRTK